MDGSWNARRVRRIVVLSLVGAGCAVAQDATPAPAVAAPDTTTQQPAVVTPAPPAAQGGTIHGTILAGTPGKPGGIPLPGVAITAKNTLTGKLYSTSTDIDGNYAMVIPKNGRYVVRVELAGFASTTQEVVLTGVEAQAATQGIKIVEKPTDFAMQLASRVEAAEAKQEAATSRAGALLGSGTQGLSLSMNAETTDVTAGNANSGASLPSLSGMGTGADASADSVAVTGQAGQMNSLAGFSEDDIRQRVEDRVNELRANGSLQTDGDTTSAIVGVLGGMMSGGGFSGGGGPGGGGSGGGGFGGGGGRGGGGGGGRGGGGSGAFRNFNPSQPHGSIFYQVGNQALNSGAWSPTLLPTAKPAGYSNRFGITLAASPYIPGIMKADPRQFLFANVTGQKNLNAVLLTGHVPTDAERTGDFSQSVLGNGTTPNVTLYDPNTGAPIPGNNLANASIPISAQAQRLLAYYPSHNIPADSRGNNYETVSNAGNNAISVNARYVRTLGGNAQTPFANFTRRSSASNEPPSLKQNINIGYNYSHNAADQRQIFLPLSGATFSNGVGLNVGYTISYGRLSNNASVNWNRLNSSTRNYFTNTSVNPSDGNHVGLSVPNNSGGFANSNFYNGLPTFSFSNFTSLTNTSPSNLINQTISYSDFVAYRHKKHNFRIGFDFRRVHRDEVGGNRPLGSYSFTGYATARTADQTSGNAGTQGASGDAFADFLLGLPQTTSIQADLYKTYLRENVYDWYAMDDWRAASNFTINYSIRSEYFGPYSEKDNHLSNLIPNANYTAFTRVTAGVNGTSRGLINPDYTMYAPRIGFAWRPKAKFAKDIIVRGGYSIMYNTGQYAVFAQKLSGQEPYAVVQTNTFSTGCQTITPSTPYSAAHTMTLAQGFGCSTAGTVNNNWAVDKSYKLGRVQLYNFNLQRTIPFQIVMNIGYNGSYGNNLDLVGSPNGVPTSINPLGNTTSGVNVPFDYETSQASSRSNQLVISAQKRQQKGISLGATYTYSHTIDNASGVGGAVGTPVQNLFNIAAEEGNASFDQRHNLSGNWIIELPFGPNRAYLNKGGFWAYVLDGYSLSGNFTFASGTYYTPQYSGSSQEALSGNTYVLRPTRVTGQSIKGPQNINKWFNTSAFAAPVSGATTIYGTAAQGSIEGPGTVSVSSSLSRTLQLKGTQSFEARVTATNVFNTVQYNSINVNVNSQTFGEVTSAAAMRTLLVQARYRW